MASRFPIALFVLATMIVATPAWARHRHYVPPRRLAYPTVQTPLPAGGWQYEAIARATARMQAAPGVTNELAPDAKETATGGPVGGVPGFSGGQ